MSIILKKGREKPLKGRHPWIFSGAIDSFPEPFEEGAIYAVSAFDGGHLGYGYFRKCSSLAGRMVSFDDKDPLESLEEKLSTAFAYRKALFDDSSTNAFRIINAEGDGLPGLIVDRYGDYLVLQIGTLGMERLKGWIVEKLLSLFPSKGIFEKSDGSSRREEGLSPIAALLYGEIPDKMVILEEGLSFAVSIQKGQKTGFFLDQREMRKAVLSYAKDRRVLNAFSYSGAFSVYALKGGALSVDTVDSSKGALELAQENLRLNGLDDTADRFIEADLFHFLVDTNSMYDLIVLDPPAFAKKSQDTPRALRAYKDLNRLAMKRLNPNGILITASCSYHVDEEAFMRAVKLAAIEAQLDMRLMGKHRLAPDHPIGMNHPEGAYIKSLILSVGA